MLLAVFLSFLPVLLMSMDNRLSHLAITSYEEDTTLFWLALLPLLHCYISGRRIFRLSVCVRCP